MKPKKVNHHTRLSFRYNNLNSVLQLTRMECLPQLNNISIDNNDITKTTTFKSFILYRFANVTTINGEPVSELDKQLSAKLFKEFDKALCVQFLLKVSLNMIIRKTSNLLIKMIKKELQQIGHIE